MAVKTEQIQVRVDFITDESRAFAKTINETDKFNIAIKESQKQIDKYNKELRAANLTEEQRALKLKAIEVEQQKVALYQQKITDAAKETAKIDLSKLTPAQLIERSKQLAQAMKNIPESAPAFRQLNDELAGVNTRLRDLRQSSQGLNATSGQGGGFFSSFIGKAAGVIAVITGIGASVAGVISATRETEKLFAVLKNAVGGENKAQAIFKELQDFAATTPFALNEVVGAFTKLQQRDFNPTIEQLRTMGDIAAASGKSLDQFVEAILDAQTGEFERLKEFGIVAKKQGDNVSVTFRGQSETFKNTSENISAYLLKLGQLPGIAGSTAAVAATLDGSLSNLGDNFTRLFATLGSGGGILKGIVDFFGKIVESVNDLLSVPLSDKLKEQQTEFNTLVGVLKDVNASEATRNQAIAELQAKYPDYIGKINLEKASQDDLNKLLVSGNQLFERRIFLRQNEEQLVEFAKQRIKLEKDLFEAQKKQSELQQSGQAGTRAIRFGGTSEVGSERVQPTRGDTEAARVQALKDALAILSGKQQEFTKNQEQFAASLFGSAEAAKAAADAQKKANDVVKSSGSSGAPSQEQIKKALEVALQATEAAALRREVVLEKFRLDGTVNEERFQDGLLGIQKKKYEEQLAVYERFGKASSTQALKLKNQILDIEQKTTRPLFVPETAALTKRDVAGPTSQADGTQAALGRQDIGEKALQAELRRKFEAALVTEQDYDLQRLELKRLALAEEIAILQAATQPQVDEIAKREEAKFKLEADIAQKRLDNEKRTEEVKKKVQEQGVQATSDLFAVAADLLAQDEVARKKNASVIKSFQSAQVIIQGIAEVQKIWAGAAALGPIAGPIVGAIQTAVAVGRTVGAVAKIQSTKFAAGGDVKFFRQQHALESGTTIREVTPLRRLAARMGFFGGKSHAHGGTKGYFDDGTRIEVERDEAFVIVNKRNAPILRTLSAVNAYGGHGVPFYQSGGLMRFADGGLPSLNTTPIPSAAINVQSNAQVNFSGFMEAVEGFRQVVAAFPTEVKSRVVYTDIEDAGSTLNGVRSDAAI